MDIEALRQSPIGRLVPISGTDPRTMSEYHHFAFLPDPLPASVDLDQETWSSVVGAGLALGRLQQVCAQIPNPQLLIAPALVKEAQATSALEGTFGDLPDVLESRLPGFEPRSPEVREIVGYEQMAHSGFEWIKDRPITMSMLCDLQRILAESARKRPPCPGEVRGHQVVIGPEECPIPEARFVPPPPGDHLRAALDDWQTWINSDHGLHVLVSAAIAHYQFECIHPFADCNGRVGRLVVLLQLLQGGALDHPALTISGWLVRRRDDYQDHLLAVSRTGDWNPWVRFFCRAISEQSERHVDVANQMLEWIADLRRQLTERRWTGVIVKVAEDLISWPIISNNLITLRHGVRAPAAQSALDRLQELGAVRELTGRKYARVYGARQVMTLVESL